MSLAVTHFAIGATLTAILVWLVAPTYRYRGSLTVAGGIWALIPDFYYVSPMFFDKLRGIRQSAFGNVFWFHQYLDSLVKGRGSRRTAGIAIGVLLVVIVFVEWQDRSLLATVRNDE